MLRTTFLCTAALVLSAQTTLKQMRPSPGASVMQEVGISTVKIDYYRPGVKGREIWGKLVPQTEIWRAGANEATVLTLSDPATIAGKPVPAGSYALMVIPGKDKWTWILSKNAKQWGTYAYKAEEDLMRFEAPVRAMPHSQEWMTFDIDLAKPDTAKVELRWEKLASAFEISFDTKAIYWAHLEDTLKKAKPEEGMIWLQAATYCIQNKVQLDKAAEWLEVSLKAGVTVRNLGAKANLLKLQGKSTEALATLDKAIALAADPASKTSKAAQDNLAKLKADWTAGK